MLTVYVESAALGPAVADWSEDEIEDMRPAAQLETLAAGGKQKTHALVGANPVFR